MTNTLSTTIHTGISLTPTGSGTYQSPFTITDTGAIIPYYGSNDVFGSVASGSLSLLNEGLIEGENNASSGYGFSGVILSHGNLTNINSGTITGGNGYAVVGPGLGASYYGGGGFGAYLHSSTVINSGTITGGSSPNGPQGGGDGVFLDSGTLANTNSGIITGGRGGYVYPGPTVLGIGGDGVYLNGSTLTNYGTITGGNGETSRGGYGVDLNSGIITNFGTIAGGGGGPAPGSGASAAGGGGGGINLQSGTLTNSGTIIGGNGSSPFGDYAGGGVGANINGGTLIDSGKIAGGTSTNAIQADSVKFSSAGTLVVEAGASFVGSVVASNTKADVLAIGGTSAVSLVGLGTEYQNFHTLAFATGATGNVSGTFAAFSGLNVTSFALGDTLVLDGFAETSDTYVSGTGLVLSNGTSSPITLDITGSFATSNFTVVDPPGNTTISLNSMPCFAAGTRILTSRGEIQVEQMREGTSVILADGRIVPVTWIGHRTVDIARHPHPETVRPVLIMAGAISDGMPARDLYLSPDHAVALDGHLIPAKTLINGSTIRQVDRHTVTYYHVELLEHAVLWAEGTPCETYLETGNRHAFETGAAPVIALRPAFSPTTPDSQKIRETRSCAPLVEDGRVVTAVRARLLSRANVATTSDADLSITSRGDGSIAITSRSTIPGYVSPDPRDRRCLGVKIASIVRKDGTFIPLDHPDLVTGWHDAEPDGRWTNGHALIPASLVGDGLADITLAATLAYPADQDQAASQRRFGS